MRAMGIVMESVQAGVSFGVCINLVTVRGVSGGNADDGVYMMCVGDVVYALYSISISSSLYLSAHVHTICTVGAVPFVLSAFYLFSFQLDAIQIEYCYLQHYYSMHRHSCAYCDVG